MRRVPSNEPGHRMQQSRRLQSGQHTGSRPSDAPADGSGDAHVFTTNAGNAPVRADQRPDGPTSLSDDHGQIGWAYCQDRDGPGQAWGVAWEIRDRLPGCRRAGAEPILFPEQRGSVSQSGCTAFLELAAAAAGAGVVAARFECYHGGFAVQIKPLTLFAYEA